MEPCLVWTVGEFFQFLEIVAWPTVVITTIGLIRPHLSQLLSGAKVKISIAGQSVETTLPELQLVFEEQSGADLSPERMEYLVDLQRSGTKHYPSGLTSDEAALVRPLRNAGLIVTVPRNEYLAKAVAIELSALGRLFLRAKRP